MPSISQLAYVNRLTDDGRDLFEGAGMSLHAQQMLLESASVGDANAAKMND